MKNFKIIILLITVLIFGSCEKRIEDKAIPIMLPSFVLSYYEMDSFSLHEYTEKNRPALSIYGNALKKNGEWIVYDSLKNAEIYQELCRKHQDLTYNHTIYFKGGDYFLNDFFANDFISLEIQSNADYDEQHLAGTLLNDRVRYMSLSSYKFIQNQYGAYEWNNPEELASFKKYFWRILRDHYNNSTAGRGGFYPIDKLVSELNLDDLKIFGPGYLSTYKEGGEPLAYLFFEHPPTLSKTHTFTVTLTTDDGKVFEDTITVTFE